jgi:hypothetical protein
MIREIKFRAKSISNDWTLGNWVYGTFYKDKNDYYMVEEITGSHIKINPETVGQFTGLPDKNKNEIYEGDIIHFGNDEGLWSDQINKNEVVPFPYICGNANLGEIIGNVHENLELVRGNK